MPRLASSFAGNGEGCRASQVSIDYVASYAVSRADVIFECEVRQSMAKFVQKVVVVIGNRDARRAAFPNAHEPYRVEAIVCYGVPLGCGDGSEIDRGLPFPAQIRQPHPGVDLID